jgi:hypothetical protein
MLGPDARVRAYLDVTAVRRELIETDPPAEGQGRWDWAVQLWRIMTLECWLRWQEEPGAPRALAERLKPPEATLHLQAPGVVSNAPDPA